MPKLILLIISLLAIVSCRQKNADDNLYYQPYRKDSITIVKQLVARSDSLKVIDLEVKPEECNPVNIDDKYFIVIASYSVEQYALAMKSELEKEGFKPQIIIVNNDGWNKLAISSYNNFEEATVALNLIRQKKGRFSDARLVVR